MARRMTATSPCEQTACKQPPREGTQPTAQKSLAYIMAFPKGTNEKDKTRAEYFQNQSGMTAKSVNLQQSKFQKTLMRTSRHLRWPPRRLPAHPQDPTKFYSWDFHYLLWQVTGQASLAISSTTLIEDYSAWDRQTDERLTEAVKKKESHATSTYNELFLSDGGLVCLG